MTVNAYQMLFTDQNLNREFVIQPYTMNGPQTPTGGVDPSASSANTTLFLYGKGAPNYGERIQEDMIYVLENFFGMNEPSFPIPGQMWFKNNDPNASQLYVYNARKYTVVSSVGNVIGIQCTLNPSTDAAAALARFTALGLTKAFTFYSPTYQPVTVTQAILPTLLGSTVYLTVTPTPASSLAGYFTGGWEDVFQGNCVNVLRTSFNANGQYIQNVPTPVLAGDAANKAYVDAAVSGGTLTLSSLSDVLFATPGSPQNNSFLFFNGSKWTDFPYTDVTFPLVQKAGDTMTGALILNADPVTNLGAATKQYVDNQSLSNLFTSIVSPVNNNVLAYDAGTLKWMNKTAAAAGLLALSGGTMAGTLNMGGNVLTALTTPTNPSDAATKAYVDAATSSLGAITAATYNNVTGVLTISQTGSPPVFNITGFLPTPNNQVTSAAVVYTPPDPASVGQVPGMFFQTTLSDVGFGAPNSIQDPGYIQASAALSAIDLALGNFVVPRGRLVMQGTGTNTTFNLNTGSPNTVVGGQPGLQYVVGTSGLGVYVNGIKQVPSDRGFFKLTGINTTTVVTGVTFGVGTATLTVPGNYQYVLRAGTQFTISGTSTVNDGSYTVVSNTVVGPNTNVTVTPNLFSATPGTGLFVASGVGTLTYGPFGIMPGMQTGYQFGGPSNSVNLDVSVNGNVGVTQSIDTSVTNCNTFGLLADAVNAGASAYYINPIVGVVSGAGGSFIVSGNRVSQFSVGTFFEVRYSSGNTGTYTVGAGGPAYNPISNQTTFPVTGTISSASVDGIVFQDNWGYTMTIENGTIVFYSNVGGSASAVNVLSGTLLTNITGQYWPITIASITGTTNPFAPQDYAYVEVGLQGYLSSVFDFTSAPQGPVPGPADVIEVIVDHDMAYNKFNPTLTAVTA